MWPFLVLQSQILKKKAFFGAAYRLALIKEKAIMTLRRKLYTQLKHSANSLQYLSKVQDDREDEES